MASKRIRAPRGYVRGKVQTFTLTDENGQQLAPITIQPFISTETGAVVCFGLSNDTADGMLKRPSMAEWRAAVTDALRSRMVSNPPTKHIAVVCQQKNGRYCLVFWPVWRQVAFDGTVYWADQWPALQAGAYLPDHDEIDWTFGVREWCTSQPWVWLDEHHRATVIDWSPDAWTSLLAVRRQLDAAMAQLGAIVTQPDMLLGGPVHRLLVTGDE